MSTAPNTPVPVNTSGAPAPVGILLLDKPLGLSSNAALQRVRRVFNRVKAGHTGSLDPLATGMLPICLGEATKIAGDLLDGDKAYEFILQLGERRSTGDREGEVVETAPVPADAGQRLADVVRRFVGPQSQVPPLYSALKHQGQPLYRLARRGEDVPRQPRQITIHALELLGEPEPGQFRLAVQCSKGTYVRTLGEDLAAAIGSCGHLAALRRVWSAPFVDQPMVGLEELQRHPDPASLLLGADAGVPHLPAVQVGAGALDSLRHGQRVRGAWPAPGRVRVYGPGGGFQGIGEVLPGGLLHPRRLFNGLDPALA